MAFQLTLIIFFLPLLTLFFHLILSSRLSGWDGKIPLIGSGVALILSAILFFFCPKSYFFWQGSWISLGEISLSFSLGLDRLSAPLVFLVNFLFFCVTLRDTGKNRGWKFWMVVSGLQFGLLGLLLVQNFFFALVFWELLGLLIYVAILCLSPEDGENFPLWAILSHLTGSLGFLLALVVLFFALPSLDYETILREAHGQTGLLPFFTAFSLDLPSLLSLLLIWAFLSKAPLFPFHSWALKNSNLPPSLLALIYGIVGGVAAPYLALRFFPLLGVQDFLYHGHYSNIFLALWGGGCAFFAFLFSLVQRRLNSWLIWTHIGQGGLFFLALGLGAYEPALMILCVGTIIQVLLFFHSSTAPPSHPQQSKFILTSPFFTTAILLSTALFAFSAFYFGRGMSAQAWNHWSLQGALGFMPFFLLIGSLAVAGLSLGKGLGNGLVSSTAQPTNLWQNSSFFLLILMALATLALFGQPNFSQTLMPPGAEGSWPHWASAVESARRWHGSPSLFWPALWPILLLGIGLVVSFVVARASGKEAKKPGPLRSVLGLGRALIQLVEDLVVTEMVHFFGRGITRLAYWLGLVETQGLQKGEHLGGEGILVGANQAQKLQKGKLQDHLYLTLFFLVFLFVVWAILVYDFL